MHQVKMASSKRKCNLKLKKLKLRQGWCNVTFNRMVILINNSVDCMIILVYNCVRVLCCHRFKMKFLRLTLEKHGKKQIKIS